MKTLVSYGTQSSGSCRFGGERIVGWLHGPDAKLFRVVQLRFTVTVRVQTRTSIHIALYTRKIYTGD